MEKPDASFFDRGLSKCPSKNASKRKVLNDLLDLVIVAFQSKNASKIVEMMDDEVQYMYLGSHQNGKENASSALHRYLNEFDEIHLYLRRNLIDVDQNLVACELTARMKKPSKCATLSPPKTSFNYEEKLLAWVIKFSVDEQGPTYACRISEFCLWLDQNYHGNVNSLETPLPSEVWEAHPHPGHPLDKQQIEDLIKAKVEAFSSENIHKWDELVDDDIILHPPWDSLRGRDSCRRGIEIYFKNYKDTKVIALRTLFDETQPNFVVHQQIFQTTNKHTQKRGSDMDFVFIEVSNRKIRYWRTYFDTHSSVQRIEQTDRFQTQSSQIRSIFLSPPKVKLEAVPPCEIEKSQI